MAIIIFDFSIHPSAMSAPAYIPEMVLLLLRLEALIVDVSDLCACACFEVG